MDLPGHRRDTRTEGSEAHAGRDGAGTDSGPKRVSVSRRVAAGSPRRPHLPTHTRWLRSGRQPDCEDTSDAWTWLHGRKPPPRTTWKLEFCGSRARPLQRGAGDVAFLSAFRGHGPAQRDLCSQVTAHSDTGYSRAASPHASRLSRRERCGDTGFAVHRGRRSVAWGARGARRAAR